MLKPLNHFLYLNLLAICARKTFSEKHNLINVTSFAVHNVIKITQNRFHDNKSESEEHKESNKREKKESDNGHRNDDNETTDHESPSADKSHNDTNHNHSNTNTNNNKPKQFTKRTFFQKPPKEPGLDLTPAEQEKFKIWPEGLIPYYIDEVSFIDEVFRNRIRFGLHLVNSMTSLQFVELSVPPVDNVTRWVFFINRRGLLGCADHSVIDFTNKGVQKVVLGYDCMANRGELAEAVMAIAGVPAQHNSPDRDDHITVDAKNIMPGKQKYFKKLNNDEWLFHDLDYDFSSITHYDSHKYSINGRATIKPRDHILNIAQTLSDTDLKKIGMLYNYITKKSAVNVKVCKEMFESGIQFENYSPHVDIFKPRKKPSKYTGVLSDENDNTNDNHEDKNNSQHDRGGRNKNNVKKKKNLIRYLEKRTLSDYTNRISHDPLVYLSDYSTGDENAKKNLIKKLALETLNYREKLKFQNSHPRN